MQLRKTLIVVTTLLGIYGILRKYQKERKPVAKRVAINITKDSKYKHLTIDEAKEEFRRRMAAGEWLTKEEYAELIDAMKSHDQGYSVLNQLEL